jgi:hypothetical protein
MGSGWRLNNDRKENKRIPQSSGGVPQNLRIHFNASSKVVVAQRFFPGARHLNVVKSRRFVSD